MSLRLTTIVIYGDFIELDQYDWLG